MENIIEQVLDYSKRGTGFITNEGLKKYSELFNEKRIMDDNKISVDVLEVLDFINSKKNF